MSSASAIMVEIAFKSMNLQIGSGVVLALFLTTTTAHPFYQNYIPNGANVPSPCQSGSVWSGVGHKVPGGGGDRNPFGLAFAANQYNWTKVCQLDSDGDGRTNGKELGDPSCTWTMGMTSPPAIDLSHPGICEPLNSMNCMSANSWLTCPAQFTCPAINQPGVLNATLRFPPTPVPANVTTYLRYGFFLPNDTDYQIIAYTPVINTSQVLHHMILYGCNDGFTNYSTYSTPQPSDIMPQPNCSSIITLWTVGVSGYCMPASYGILIGKHGFKYALLEFHWNNPTQSSSFVDSSGMTIYFTPTLRPNSGGVVTVGQDDLNILPGLSSTSFQGGCSSYCTSALPETIYITGTIFHMHLLGIAGSVKLFRNGVFNTTLLNAPSYSYNSPVSVTFDSPIEFRPGDSLVVNCTYNSTGQTSTVKYGESTSNEMCYAFMSYYPVNPRFTTCSKWRTLDSCSNIPDRCSTNGFYTLISIVPGVCMSPTNCSSTCKDLMQAIVNTGCVTDDYMFVVSSYSSITAQYIAHFVPLCGVSNQPSTSPLSTSTTMASTSPTVTKTSPRPNSATRLSMKMTLIHTTALPSLIFILMTLLEAM